jgi:tetratricopeptide (TPR) repeat protein
LRASIYSKQGKRNEGIADYGRILSKSPDEPEIYGLRANLFRSLNQANRALDDYEQQTRLDPHNAEAWLHLAGMYLVANRLDAAGKAVDRAIELAPDTVSAYQLRARVDKENADWKGELMDIDRMLILEPNNNWAKSYRPDVLLRIAQSAAPVWGDDTYAVYSAVLLHPVWDHADSDTLLLIAESTGATYGGMDPGKCIEAPAAYQKQVDQALADYAARKSLKVQLRPDFRITRPYKLLSDADTQQFVNFRFRGAAPDPKLARLFSETPDLIRLSQVFFDQNHTLAMVLVSNYCGGLCGGEKWRILIKRKGVWVDQDWARCMTIS